MLPLLFIEDPEDKALEHDLRTSAFTTLAYNAFKAKDTERTGKLSRTQLVDAASDFITRLSSDSSRPKGFEKPSQGGREWERTRACRVWVCTGQGLLCSAA